MFSQKTVLLAATLVFSSSVVAVDTTSTYLPNIVNAITTGCSSACTPFENAITTCVNKFTAPLDLATCSCSGTFLAALYSCAVCEDASTPGGAQQVNYNGFQQQCVSANLASGGPQAFPAGSGSSATGAAAGISPTGTTTRIAAPSTVAPVVTSTPSSSIISTKAPTVSVASVTSAAANVTSSAKSTNAAVSARGVKGGLMGCVVVVAALVL